MTRISRPCAFDCFQFGFWTVWLSVFHFLNVTQMKILKICKDWMLQARLEFLRGVKGDLTRDSAWKELGLPWDSDYMTWVTCLQLTCSGRRRTNTLFENTLRGHLLWGRLVASFRLKAASLLNNSVPLRFLFKRRRVQRKGEMKTWTIVSDAWYNFDLSDAVWLVADWSTNVKRWVRLEQWPEKKL